MKRIKIIGLVAAMAMLSACGSTQTAEVTEPSTEAIETQDSTVSETTEAVESESITETEEATETSETAETEAVDNFLTDNNLVDKITSDLTINDEVHMGIGVIDSNNDVIAVVYNSMDDWMTTATVPFETALSLDSVSHMTVSGTDVYAYAFSYEVSCDFTMTYNLDKLQEQYTNSCDEQVYYCFPALFMVDPDKNCGAVGFGYSYYDEQEDGSLIVQASDTDLIFADDVSNYWKTEGSVISVGDEGNNVIEFSYTIYTSDVPTELYCAYASKSQEYFEACAVDNAIDYDFKSDWNSHTEDWHLMDLIPTIQSYTGEVTELGESMATTYDECTTGTDIETWGVYFYNCLAEM